MEEFTSSSKRMLRLLAALDDVALSPSPVLIRGEMGSGREYIARKIHEKRGGGVTFVPVKCLGAGGNFLSGLGLEGGNRACTLFLDGLQALARDAQDALHEFLSGESHDGIKLLASASGSLDDVVLRGEFRRDLLVRLDLISVTCPPLRERAEDIIPFGVLFLARYAREMNRDVRGFSPAAIKKLEAYHWPGNIRELRNVIERAILHCRGGRLEEEDIVLSVGRTSSDHKAVPAGLGLKEAANLFKKSYIEDTIAASAGNKAEAARRLGLERTYLFALIKDLGVDC